MGGTVCLKLPSQYLSGGTEENDKNMVSVDQDGNPGPSECETREPTTQ